MNPVLRIFVRYALLAPLAAIVLIAACTSVNTKNYQRIETGMTREQVYSIIGKPDQINGGGIDELWVSAETWRGRNQTIHVVFGGDSVAVKSIRLGDAAD